MTDATAAVTTRWINLWEATPDESAQIEFIRESRGWTKFSPRLTRLLVAEHAGRIIGFHVLQLVAHPEPQYLDPEFRGRDIAESLAREMNDFLHEIEAPAWQCTADSEHAAKLCETFGMVKITAAVYKGGA